jgi:GTP-binding protein YchF
MEYEVLTKIRPALMDQIPIRALKLSADEEKIIRNFSFLTAKPMLYVCNVSDDEITDYSMNPYVKSVQTLADSEGAKVSVISAKIESELSELPDEDKTMFLEELGVKESGLLDLIRKSYELLGLKTFFTAGEKEVRAWTYHHGMKAPECAGIIHSDFEKGFIRAEIIAYDDLIRAGSETKAKEQGKFRLEGKEYEMQDGDIVHFRFNL